MVFGRLVYFLSSQVNEDATQTNGDIQLFIGSHFILSGPNTCELHVHRPI